MRHFGTLADESREPNPIKSTEKDSDQKPNFELKTKIIKPTRGRDQGTKPDVPLGALKKTQNKLSAFKLPLAQGKGEILPALEKDMLQIEPTFENLSKLVKEKEKAKFYATNN